MRIIFADLDGTILDRDNYSSDASSEGISVIKKTGIPLILASAKTRAEMGIVSEELDIDFPFIFENGCGIDFREGENCLMLSPPVESMIDILTVLRQNAPGIKTVTDMSVKEMMLYTGLSGKNARLAQMRTGSLPFIIENENISESDRVPEFNLLIKGSGFKVLKGARFYHLVSEMADKGAALKQVILFYENRPPRERIYSAAIGDAENDIAMLEAADTGFFVGENPPRVKIPEGILFTEKKGPEGFNEAVERIIR